MIVIPNLQFRASSILLYNSVIDRPDNGFGRFKRKRQDEFTANLKNVETYTGKLSPGAHKRMFKSINLLIQSVKTEIVFNPYTEQWHPFSLSFITLTIHSPGRMIDANEGYKKCLAPFLQWIRRKYGCTSYVWKAELQSKTRPQLHYHLTTNVFVPKIELQKKWNELQAQAGYLDSYFKMKGHYNAPSTHIKGVKNAKKVAYYFVKEVSKQLQNKMSVGGKVWDCSINLKGKKFFTIEAAFDYDTDLDILVKAKQVVRKDFDFCTVFDFLNKPSVSILTPKDKLLFEKSMADIRNEVTDSFKKDKRTVQELLKEVNTTPEKTVLFVPQLSFFSSS